MYFIYYCVDLSFRTLCIDSVESRNSFLITVLNYATMCVSVLSEILTIDLSTLFHSYYLYYVCILTHFICNPKFKFFSKDFLASNEKFTHIFTLRVYYITISKENINRF